MPLLLIIIFYFTFFMGMNINVCFLTQVMLLGLFFVKLALIDIHCFFTLLLKFDRLLFF